MTAQNPSSTSVRESFTIAEFCERHGISRSTFGRFVKAGMGPTLMHIGSTKRISRKAERRWIAMMEAGGPQEPDEPSPKERRAAKAKRREPSARRRGDDE